MGVSGLQRQKKGGGKKGNLVTAVQKEKSTRARVQEPKNPGSTGEKGKRGQTAKNHLGCGTEKRTSRNTAARNPSQI